MKTNKEIITKIIKGLESTVVLNWPKRKDAKISRENLIECWSQNSIPEWKFYGYTNKSSASIPYNNIFKNIQKLTVSESWKDYILRTNDYKYCQTCKELYNVDKFATNNSMVSKLQAICKDCQSIYRSVNKENIAEYSKAYYENNKASYIAKDAKRRAAKLKRTPKWLTEEDHWMFNEIYSLAKLREELTGVKWHVDHIIPLQGTLVSGLHVPTNLQVITAKRNLEKSNKYVIK